MWYTVLWTCVCVPRFEEMICRELSRAKIGRIIVAILSIINKDDDANRKINSAKHNSKEYLRKLPNL